MPCKQLRKEEKQKAQEKRKKEKIYPYVCRVPRTARRDKKPSSMINEKKQRKTKEWETLEICSRKLEIPKEYYMQKWSQ